MTRYFTLLLFVLLSACAPKLDPALASNQAKTYLTTLYPGVVFNGPVCSPEAATGDGYALCTFSFEKEMPVATPTPNTTPDVATATPAVPADNIPAVSPEESPISNGMIPTPEPAVTPPVPATSKEIRVGTILCNNVGCRPGDALVQAKTEDLKGDGAGSSDEWLMWYLVFNNGGTSYHYNDWHTYTPDYGRQAYYSPSYRPTANSTHYYHQNTSTAVRTTSTSKYTPSYTKSYTTTSSTKSGTSSSATGTTTTKTSGSSSNSTKTSGYNTRPNTTKTSGARTSPSRSSSSRSSGRR